MMATVGHVTSSSGLRKFQTDGFLLGRVYQKGDIKEVPFRGPTNIKFKDFVPQLVLY
jgi:hypothetical protein